MLMQNSSSDQGLKNLPDQYIAKILVSSEGPLMQGLTLVLLTIS